MHYSAVLAVGFRSLEVGQAVTFTSEAVEQDGYAHRALEVWPSDAEPVRMASDPSTPSAYWSTLTLAFDDDQ